MTGRRAAQRQETETRIRQAALAVFARMGFAAATMDCIATEAGGTKPTLSSCFDSKDALFAAVLLAPREDMLLPIAAGQSDAHVTQMHGFAWQYARVVLRADYLSLARLVIGKAQKHPEIGAAYQRHGPDLVLAGLTDFMVRHGALGHLRINDPELAAEDFWGLILSALRNRALQRPDDLPKPTEVARYIENGLRVFLRAYSSAPDSDLGRLSAILRASRETA